MMCAHADSTAPDFGEEVLTMSCHGERLLGILARPLRPAATDLAVLVVVGGPQYRVGSHRQFTLLARRLAAAGLPVLRFDCRGMGDSEGAMRNFEGFEDDIAVALDALAAACPSAKRLAVWGLCDAASAALMFCAKDARVAGMVLANPWVRSEATLAQTHLKHYYPGRVLQRDFWLKVLSGRFDWRRAFGSLLGAVHARLQRISAGPQTLSFQQRMAAGWRAYRGRILLVIAGEDLTAKEFLESARQDPIWLGLLAQPKVERFDLPEANHTFSSAAWRAAVEHRTLSWLLAL